MLNLGGETGEHKVGLELFHYLIQSSVLEWWYLIPTMHLRHLGVYLGMVFEDQVSMIKMIKYEAKNV